MQIPSHLSEKARKWVSKVAGDYVLGEQDCLVLIAAAECWDRYNQAREILGKEGLTFTDRHKAIRPHPCCAIEKENKTLFARLIRDLNLPVPTSELAGVFDDE